MNDTQSTHVILFCHGSSDPSGGARELTHQLQETYGQNQVHLGFLERSEPDLQCGGRKIAQLWTGPRQSPSRFFYPRGNISEKTYLLCSKIFPRNIKILHLS